MGYKYFRLNIFVRTILLIISASFLVWLIFYDGYFFIQLATFSIIIIQLIYLMRFLDTSHEEFSIFINRVTKKENPIKKYKIGNKSALRNALHKEFNIIIEKINKKEQEKQADYHYLKNIIHHVGIGILSFDSNGEIQIINTQAKKLLHVSQLNHIDELKKISPILVDSLLTLTTGGRTLIKIEYNKEIFQLAIYVIELTLKNKIYKLVSLQNIHSELEEKEMEAWQNLIRVLTHEIMNSVTPISSLAATVDEELLQLTNKEKYPDKILSQEDMEDLHLAVQTIQRRSKGLIRFVSDFRNLTKIPVPQLRKVKLTELFETITVLFKKEFDKNNIIFKTTVQDEKLEIYADKELVEQVLINLIKNAIYAVKENAQKKNITLTGTKSMNNRVTIRVIDNGSGISEEALEKVFIPFFTTKKTGSGIGLSLSRQIMRQHKGSLSVKSTEKGTEFVLIF